MLRNLIESAVIVPALVAREKVGAFKEVVDHLVGAGVLTKKASTSVHKQLLEREQQGSTGLGNGVAVPHIKDAGVKDMQMLLAVSQQGIEFDAIDGRPVQTLFLILAPGTAPELHLQVLRWISTLARNADFRRFVVGAKDEAELRDLLLEMSETP